MTNFEKILKGTKVQDVADALSAYFESQCNECPARGMCEAVTEDDDRSCTEVLVGWLESEAEG